MVERNYCKYCKCWTQGDKVSIQRHESSNHHKYTTRIFFQQQKKEKRNEEYAEKNMKRELRQIEQEAHRRHQRDRHAGSSSNYLQQQQSANHLQQQELLPPTHAGPQLPPSSSMTAVAPVPFHYGQNNHPQPFQPHHYQQYPPQHHQQYLQFNQPQFNPPQQQSNQYTALQFSNDRGPLTTTNPPSQSHVETKNSPAQPSTSNCSHESDIDEMDIPEGVYQAKGLIYLEAKCHPQKFVPGLRCQVWIEEGNIEAWLDAKIIEQCKVSDPETPDEKIYRVQYFRPKTEDDDSTDHHTCPRTVEVDSITPEDLRYRFPSDTSMKKVKDHISSQLPLNVIRPSERGDSNDDDDDDENDDGIGAWSTVAVTEVVSEEEKESEPLELKENSILKQQIIQAEEETGDALSAFNPQRGGMYKGMKLSKDRDSGTYTEAKGERREHLALLQSAPTTLVVFKKRKNARPGVKKHQKRLKGFEDE